MFFLNPHSQVVLITGGNGQHDDLTSSEIYDPSTQTSCLLPNFTNWRTGHSQDGPLLCGGGQAFSDDDNTLMTCTTWSQGTWNVSHHLTFRRQNHISWTPTSGAGTYLMGGKKSQNYPDPIQKTEIVRPDGTVEQGFDLVSQIR